MKVIIILSCVALATAKPQGYSYSQPAGSFSSSSSSSLSGGLSLPSTASAPSFVPPPSFSAPSFSAPSFSAPAQAAAPQFSAPIQSFGPESAIVQKHIYVHVPPPDHDELAQEQPAQLAPVQRQKHYKIIFIKAPSAPSVNRYALLQQQALQQSEEKTLVYVLVKKPESLSDIQAQIPQIPAAPPSKPEVYFIKYKAQKDQSAPISLPSPIQSGSAPAIEALSAHSSGSAIQSLPIQPAKPAPVYGPAH